jgi:hypothetical protein
MVIERNSGVGAACDAGLGVCATLCWEAAAINSNTPQDTLNSLIGVMYFMVSFFLGKGFLGEPGMSQTREVKMAVKIEM